MSEDVGGSGVTATVKFGKGFEDPWLVFRGTVVEVRAQVIDAFGMDGASVSGLTLSELMINASKIAQGKGAVATVLGGSVIAATTSVQSGAQGKSPWAEAQEAQGPADAPQEHPLVAQIAAATSTDELRRMWAENQGAFSDAALMDAWRARGRALQAAAA